MTRTAVRALLPRAAGPLALGALGALSGWIGFMIGGTRGWDALEPTLALLTLCCLVGSVIAARPSGLARPCRVATHPSVVTAAFASLCAITLVSTISAAPVQQDFWGRIAGALPFRDGGRYYDLMASWPDAELDQWHARRPMNGALLILQAWPVNARLLYVLVIHAAVTWAAIVALVAALMPRVGRLAACAVGLMLTTWMIPMVTSCRSEPNGLALSASSVVLLLHAMTTGRRWSLAAGCIAILCAWLVRPCSPIYPPALCAFSAWMTLRHRRFRLGASCATAAGVLVAMWLIPNALTAWLGAPGSRANSNSSFALLGFAMGEDWWAAAMATVPEWQGVPESVAADRLTSRAWNLMCEEPLGMVRATLRNLQEALTGTDLRRNSSLGAQLATSIIPGPPWASWLLMPLGALALAVALGRRASPVSVMCGIALGSFVMGAPILWGSGGWRPNAILLPGLAMLSVLPRELVRSASLGPTRDPPWLAVSRRWGSRSITSAAFVSVSLTTLPLLALALVGWTRQDLPDDPQVKWPSIEFSMSEPVERVWTDSSSVRLHPLDLARWAESASFPVTAEFVRAHQDRLVRCRLLHGSIIIEVRPGSGTPAMPVALDHRFRAETAH
jgi:hypothetical protein